MWLIRRNLKFNYSAGVSSAGASGSSGSIPRYSLILAFAASIVAGSGYITDRAWDG